MVDDALSCESASQDSDGMLDVTSQSMDVAKLNLYQALVSTSSNDLSMMISIPLILHFLNCRGSFL